MLVDSNTRFHKLHQSKTKQVGEKTGSDPVRTSKTALVGGSSRIPRICEFSIFHYSICLTNTIIMYMMVSLPHRRSTELIWRPPLITAFWRVKKRDYHFWCRSYSMNTTDIELAHAMLHLHHWLSNCCLYGIFSIPVSIHRCWNRWIRVITSISWKRLDGA